ncbi:hypothetical protein L1987_12007 [Smallanthus sonchifolius]|uniref:Uncharacterized protein n=1 Tax=Smallanthus sonchifolius TaxID=185202 RepID=A0ACB9JD16_9ASTR|nr:hypothetical protein L1987_12007 [Smallanthus sonchifolius]
MQNGTLGNLVKGFILKLASLMLRQIKAVSVLCRVLDTYSGMKPNTTVYRPVSTLYPSLNSAYQTLTELFQVFNERGERCPIAIYIFYHFYLFNESQMKRQFRSHGWQSQWGSLMLKDLVTFLVIKESN